MQTAHTHQRGTAQTMQGDGMPSSFLSSRLCSIPLEALPTWNTLALFHGLPSSTLCLYELQCVCVRVCVCAFLSVCLYSISAGKKDGSRGVCMCVCAAPRLLHICTQMPEFPFCTSSVRSFSFYGRPAADDHFSLLPLS